MMFIECKRTQIVNDDFDDSLLSRALDDPEIERPREKLRKDGQQVKAHNRWLVVSGRWLVGSDYHQPPTTNHQPPLYKSSNPSGGSTTILFRSGEISTQILRTSGIRSSRA